MRKVFLLMMVSLDGFFEGENHDLSWHNVDGEFNEFAAQMLSEVGTLMFGRRTYELMAGFWPTAKPSDPNDAIVAEKMNTLPKIVFSTTMKKVEEKPSWKNVKLAKDNVAEEVQKLKQQPGEDIAVLASSNLCISLIKMGLIDEFRIMVNPVVIGNGTPLFHGIQEKFKLKLLNTRTFNSGNVLLTYQPLN